MFKGSLIGPQVEGAEFLCNKRKALLAWEQGTGKTIISIAAREKLKELNKLNTSALVLSPGGLTWQFATRIGEFSNANVHLVRSDKKKTRFYESTSGNIDYFVVSYGLFRNDFDDIAQYPWDIVIADEAEAFSSNQSKTYQALLRLNRIQNPKYRFSLTGTAIPNTLEQLYAVMYWTDKTFLPPWPKFEKQHIRRHPQFKGIIGYKNLKPLHKYITNRVDRKTNKDFKGRMPKLVPKEITVARSEEYNLAEQRLYLALEDLVGKMEFKDGELLTKAHSPKVSKAFHKARQALVSKEKQQRCVNLVRTLLEENEKNKVVVFSFYKQPLYDLEPELTFQSVAGNSLLYTGDESLDAKQNAIGRFGKENRVLLCSNAGARGLDLPFANYIIHLDVPFSFGTLDQRNKRIVRVSSKFQRAVAYYLLVENSIEHYYYTLVRNKERLAEAVLEGTEDEVTMKVESLRQFIKDE